MGRSSALEAAGRLAMATAAWGFGWDWEMTGVGRREQQRRAGNGIEGVNGIATGAIVQHEDSQVIAMGQVAELAQ